MEKILIIGYGNVDREDDGVAWHILNKIAQQLELPEPSQETEDLDHSQGWPHLLCTLQLTPELAEVIAKYDQVCFVDAHTGAYPEDIRFEKIAGEFQPSPFTHHMTPQTCLALAETLYGCAPPGLAVSVRGHQFGFSNKLSIATAESAEAAVGQLMQWLNPDSHRPPPKPED
jgi:hydrogenase maturation protease